MHQVMRKVMIQKTVFMRNWNRFLIIFPSTIMKILLDFNAKVGRENLFKLRIGNESLHQVSNYIGVRIVTFATSKNLVVKSTISPH